MNSNHTRILIADDDRDSADTMAELLQYAGYDTRAVYDGRQAVEMASAFEPHVAILDIDMPLMDGYATARALRQWADAHVRLLIIAHTGVGQMRDIDHARRLGFDHVLAKPADSQRLMEAIASGLGPGLHD